MSESHVAVPAATAPEPVDAALPSLSRGTALFEALAVCGVPTQMLVGGLLIFVAGMPLSPGGGLSLSFFATLSLLDTLLVAALIWLFLRGSAERPRDVFVGRRPVLGEVLRGIAFVPVVLVAMAVIVLSLRALFPWLRTVEQNPLIAFLDTPLDATIFFVVVIVAGGVREELQRAFVLHRFEQRLGGVKLGLTIFSVTFAALHVQQGLDVAVAVGLLGLMWGIVYVRRRSAILPMANHACFNALQVVQGVLVKSIGG